MSSEPFDWWVIVAKQNGRIEEVASGLKKAISRTAKFSSKSTGSAMNLIV